MGALRFSVDNASRDEKECLLWHRSKACLLDSAEGIDSSEASCDCISAATAAQRNSKASHSAGYLC